MPENKEAWSKFKKYWKNTEWNNLSHRKIRKILGDSVNLKVPKDISNKDVGQLFFEQVRTEIGPPKHDFGVRICFEPVKNNTIAELFGTEPITSGFMIKRLWQIIREFKLSTKIKKE